MRRGARGIGKPFNAATLCAAAIATLGCSAKLPSERLQNSYSLPVPSARQSLPAPERLSRDRAREVYSLSARSLIPVAFDNLPSIKSSFQRFKSEEARYDFFVVSRDSLTPTFRSTNDFSEDRASEMVKRDRDHTVEVAVEKLFFDTTRLDVGVGYQTDADDDDTGNYPFVAANLRYPLWASREKLARTSEEIVRRNELNDARLAYIQTVRNQLQQAMFRFYEVMRLVVTVENATRWREDLQALRANIVARGNTAEDLSRVDAEISRVNATIRNESGRFEVDLGHLRSECGMPMYARVELVDEAFNPFEGDTHEELFRQSIETDPEILTLINEVQNAEVQLDLARRGQWDVALLAGAASALEGRGAVDGVSDWSVSVGFEVSHVDNRVTTSLIHQSESRIHQFTEAIAARENDIFVDTLEPIIRIDTLSASRDELAENLPRFVQDFESGSAEYDAGTLNIDDLLKRRETLWDQEQEIAELTTIIGLNVAELCSATGRFFDILESEAQSRRDTEQGG